MFFSIFRLTNPHIYTDCLRDVDCFYEQWANCPTSELEGTNATKRNRAMTRIQQSLIAAQELGDEKLQIVQQLTDLIEAKTRQLDQDFKNLDYGKEEVVAEVSVKENRSASPVLMSPTTNSAPISFPTSTPNPVSSGVQSSAASANGSNGGNGNGGGGAGAGSDRGTKRARRARTDTGSGMDVDNSDSNTKTEATVKQTQATAQKKAASSSASVATSSAVNNANNNSNSNKKKRKKTGRSTNANNSRDARDDTPPVEEAIDPDEPTYCLCDQISFGEMILCDNDLCPIEWFHFSCVSLMTKPKGKWFCPNCRGDRPNVMKPKAQFLKELERYNKEKEEKT